MIIEQKFTVQAPLEATAAFFLDIDRVSPCMPGVESVKEIEPGQYQAVLAVRLGPIRAAFEGTMTLDDSEAPDRLSATAQGRDKATGSVAKVAFTADLREERPGETTVVAVTDMTLRGRMAQFGTGVIRAAAGELVDEFAACANATLAAGHAPLDHQAEAPANHPASDSATSSAPVPAPVPSSSPSVLRILARSLWKALRRKVSGLSSPRDRRTDSTGRTK
jgi:carbon monoxide dehydrogenase subunit G